MGNFGNLDAQMLCSIAISLKRIADVICASPPQINTEGLELTVEDYMNMKASGYIVEKK